jgi:uncharacterized protein YegP (UPF0339 family)
MSQGHVRGNCPRSGRPILARRLHKGAGMKTTSTRSFLSLAMLLATPLVIGCATDEGDDELDPACEDAKCDAQGGTSAFEVFKGLDGKYYFHLVAGNGQIVLQSQAYSSKASATNGAKSVSTNGVNLARYELLESRSGDWYFNLKAANGAIIGTSEMYTRKYNAQRGIDTVVALTTAEQRTRAATEGGARFRTFRGADNQFYFHLKGGNGEIMLQSEGYASPGGVTTGIAAIRENGKLKSRYQVLTAANGQYYFRLKAANGEIIALGEAYKTKATAEAAVTRLVELIKSEAVADPTTIAPTPTTSVTEFDDLLAGLEGLSQVAAGGAELQYFGYGEAPAIPAGADCETISASAVKTAFRGDTDQVMEEGDADAASFSQSAMRTDFGQFIGGGSYTICTATFEGSSTMGQATYIQSGSAGGPSLFWELGWGE